MPDSSETVLRQALQLPSNERAALLEGLLASLDKPDREVDDLWLKEAQSRMAAYRSGELAAIGAEQVFNGHGQSS